jgi:N-acetylglutamate synthase-like GNAT family acetyltransferase
VTVSVRRATLDDAAALAALTGQLGYPVEADEQARRLALVLASKRDAVFVAVNADDRVVGWTHIQQRLMLESSDQALIAGLVVDEAHRSAGVGLELLAAAEAWAAELGMGSVRVLSRVERERAHRFYMREGYRLVKTSRAFDKPIG